MNSENVNTYIKLINGDNKTNNKSRRKIITQELNYKLTQKKCNNIASYLAIFEHTLENDILTLCMNALDYSPMVSFKRRHIGFFW